MAHLLGAEAVGVDYPTRRVFDAVTVGVSDGDRIGVVGRNGDGKSTLLRLLAGRQQPDSGQVTRRGGLRLGMLDQADTLPDDETVEHAVVGERAEHEWAGDARVRDVIRGLLGGIPWTARIGELSGGQRRRVALAALLSREWDVILLDEPTNHLDVEGVAWLAGHLVRRWTPRVGGLLVVTHDRWFLDAVSTATWEVHDGIVEPFEGGYAAYILQRVERDRQAAATEARRQNLARRELAWLRRGAPARTSKPKFRIDAANALIADVPELRDPVALQSLAVSRLGKDVVDLLDASVSYGGREIIAPVEWRIAPGERTAILGENGAGKSTLLGLVSGAVEPTAGRVKRGKTVRIATLTQRLDELDPVLNDPVRVVIASLRSSYTLGTGSKAQELTPGQLLERLGFSSAQLSTPVKDLSGGQKRRLQLLLVLLDQPNVLILDEPTNDMDTDMLAAMEELLDSWAGTLLVVSHDRYFIERVTDQQYALVGGHFRHLPGGVDEYLRIREASTMGAGAAGTSSVSEAAPGLSGAERHAAHKELASLDRRIEKLTAQIATAQRELAEHDPGDYEGLIAIQARVDALSSELMPLEEQWLDLGSTLES